MECIKLMPLEQIDMVVTKGINHTLEKKPEFRMVTGKLFSKLVNEKMLSQQKFSAG